MTPEIVVPDVTEIAADWFARKRSGVMTAQELYELQAWLDEALAHTEAFRAIMRTWDMAGCVATDPEMLAIREAARGQRPVRRRLLQAGFGGLCAMALAGGMWFVIQAGLFADWFAPVWEQGYRTAIGQTETVTLRDGSIVTLDTDTALHVRESGGKRLVELLRGQAFFRVAKDHTRPFIVGANGDTVTATGTKFAVRADPDLFKVTLLEGTVRVQTPPSASGPGEVTDLVPGWQFVASRTNMSVVPVSAATAARETAWLTGHIAVVAEPLGQVIADLNRYSVRKIVVTPAVAEKPIDGVFRIGDVDGFVKLVRRYRLVRVVSDTGGQIVLDAPKKSRRAPP